MVGCLIETLGDFAKLTIGSVVEHDAIAVRLEAAALHRVKGDESSIR